MRIVGIDGGLAHMGVAVLEYSGPGPLSQDDVTRNHAVSRWPGLRYLHGYVGETKASPKRLSVRQSDDNMRRAREQAQRLIHTMDGFEPHLLVYEAQSFGMGFGKPCPVCKRRGLGSIAMRQAATSFGVIAAVAEAHHLPLLSVTPRSIKGLFDVGDGAVTKDHVIRAVDGAFDVAWPGGGLDEHLADAIAAVCVCLRDDIVLAALKAERS